MDEKELLEMVKNGVISGVWILKEKPESTHEESSEVKANERKN